MHLFPRHSPRPARVGLMTLCLVAGLAAGLGAPTAALAQTQPAEAAPPPPREPERTQPLGPYAIDLRAGLAGFGANPALAASRDLPLERLPQRGYAIDIGAHVYPLRLGVVTFGFGASLVTARATWTPDLETTPEAEQVITRFTAINPQLSFNFGHRRGWSYISGGILTSVLSVDVASETRQPSPALKTINYGGGARWFAKPHVAFSFDVRFYAVNPALATSTYRGNPRQTFTVMTAGVSLR